MSEATMLETLGALSNDLILICDVDGVVREANALAQQQLGAQIIGRPLLKLLSTMSQSKGTAFLTSLRSLSDGQTSEPWELLFHLVRKPPLMVTLRAGTLADGGWLLVGGLEPPQLTALYHEVLAINSDLTTLVRQLSKERLRPAPLVTNTVISAQTYLPSPDEPVLAEALDAMREPLIQQAAEVLAFELPIMALPDLPGTSKTQHQHTMLITMRRFHDLVQIATTLDWDMVAPEFGWARRRLAPMGISWQQQQMLIDTYFAAAANLRSWDETERTVLESIAEHMRAIASQVYCDNTITR